MEAVEKVPMVNPVALSPEIKQKEKSWAKVAQGRQVMKKYDLDISISEGKRSVEVPAEIVEKSNPLWDDFVIARFLETAPHIAKVHMIVNKIWAFGETSQKLEVIVMDEKTMRIRITSEKIRDKVVRRGMWNIAGVPMVVSKWSPDVEDLNESLIPLWVHLTGVPMSMYSWEGLSFMTSAVGVPDHLHPETISCTNFDMAKVFVKADLSRELPQRIDFTIQGVKVAVDFAYPRLPARCETCSRWGHYATFCKNGKVDKAEEQRSPKSKERDVPKSGQLKKVDQGREGDNEDVIIEKERVLGAESSGGKSSNRSAGIVAVTIEEGEINEWKTISGEKLGKSPKSQSLKYGQVTIATPSRFDALRNMDEKGEEIDVERMEEVEEMRNEEVEDIVQSLAEDSVDANKKGRARQTLPRLSKTNHRVVNPEPSDHVKDMRRGSRKNH